MWMHRTHWESIGYDQRDIDNAHALSFNNIGTIRVPNSECILLDTITLSAFKLLSTVRTFHPECWVACHYHHRFAVTKRLRWMLGCLLLCYDEFRATGLLSVACRHFDFFTASLHSPNGRHFSLSQHCVAVYNFELFAIRGFYCPRRPYHLAWTMIRVVSLLLWYIEGILPKGPYLPCVSMAGRALLAGYPRYVMFIRRTSPPKFLNKDPFVVPLIAKDSRLSIANENSLTACMTL